MKSNKKKILFIHHATGWGGAPINMINIIKNLDNSKFETEVLLLKDSIVSENLSENNIPFRIAESIFYKKYYQYFIHSEANYTKWYQLTRFIKLTILWLLSRFYFAKKELKYHDFDIVHLNSSVLCDWLAPSKNKGKIVFHVQEPFRKGKFDLLHFFFRHQMRKYADQIITISKDNAHRIAIPEKTCVIYNYSELPKTLAPGHSYKSKKVLYLGGAAFIKGFYTLVDALDFLNKDVIVYFGGQYTVNNKYRSPFKRSLKLFFYNRKEASYIAKMRTHPNAIEIGLINNVHRYLNDVCCLVSPFAVPHFSRPVIEANLHGKPAIGTNVKGMDEIIDHNKNGILVPLDDPRSLAEAINSLESNSEMARLLGANAYLAAQKNFTPKNVQKFQKLYDQLI